MQSRYNGFILKRQANPDSQNSFMHALCLRAQTPNLFCEQTLKKAILFVFINDIGQEKSKRATLKFSREGFSRDPSGSFTQNPIEPSHLVCERHKKKRFRSQYLVQIVRVHVHVQCEEEKYFHFGFGVF